MPARRLPALAGDLLDLPADALRPDAQRLQRLGGDPFAFVDQAQKDVLGINVVVAERPGLSLGQDDHPPRVVGGPLQHVLRSQVRPGPLRQAVQPTVKLAESVAAELVPTYTSILPGSTRNRAALS